MTHSLRRFIPILDWGRSYNRGALFVATERLGAADEALFAEEQVFRRLGDRVHAALCRLDRGEALLRAGLIPEVRAASRF